MSMQNDHDDHRYTKIFVGNLTWKTTTDDLKTFFQTFGEILEANVVGESTQARSKGYGFVTFKYAESAARALENPFPVIDGRQTNINLAYLRVRNNNNPSNQTGSLFQAGPSHQYQNGSLNQVMLSHQYPRYYTLFPQTCYPHYGQNPYMYQYPNNSMQTCYFDPTHRTPQNLHQRNRNPVRVSKPVVRHEQVTADFVHHDNNEDPVTKTERDADQLDAADQQVEIKRGQGNGIKKDAPEEQEVEITSGQENGIKQDAAEEQEVEITSGQQENGIKQYAEEQEVEITSGQENGNKQDADVTKQLEDRIEVKAHQNGRVSEEEAKDTSEEKRMV